MEGLQKLQENADTVKQENQGGGQAVPKKKLYSCRRARGALKYDLIFGKGVLKKKQCFLQGAAGK